TLLTEPDLFGSSVRVNYGRPHERLTDPYMLRSSQLPYRKITRRLAPALLPQPEGSGLGPVAARLLLRSLARNPDAALDPLRSRVLRRGAPDGRAGEHPGASLLHRQSGTP